MTPSDQKLPSTYDVDRSGEDTGGTIRLRSEASAGQDDGWLVMSSKYLPPRLFGFAGCFW
jgi:hypothetical protein